MTPIAYWLYRKIWQHIRSIVLLVKKKRKKRGKGKIYGEKTQIFFDLIPACTVSLLFFFLAVDILLSHYVNSQETLGVFNEKWKAKCYNWVMEKYIEREIWLKSKTTESVTGIHYAWVSTKKHKQMWGWLLCLLVFLPRGCIEAISLFLSTVRNNQFIYLHFKEIERPL